MTQVRPGQIFRWPTLNMWTEENQWNMVSSQGFVACVYTRRSPLSRSFFSVRFRVFCWRITRRAWERSRWPQADANALQTLVRRRLPFWWQVAIFASSALAMRGLHFATIQKKIKTGKRKQSPGSPPVYMLQFLSTCNVKIVINLAHVHL